MKNERMKKALLDLIKCRDAQPVGSQAWRNYDVVMCAVAKQLGFVAFA